MQFKQNKKKIKNDLQKIRRDKHTYTRHKFAFVPSNAMIYCPFHKIWFNSFT